MKDLKQILEEMRKIPEVRFSLETEASFEEALEKNIGRVIKNVHNYLNFFIEHYGEREQEDYLKRLPNEIIIPDEQDGSGVIISDRENNVYSKTAWYVTRVPGESEDKIYGMCLYLKQAIGRYPEEDEEVSTILVKDIDGEIWHKNRGGLENVSSGYRSKLVWGWISTPKGFADALIQEEQENTLTLYRDTLECLLRMENLMKSRIHELHAEGLVKEKYQGE